MTQSRITADKGLIKTQYRINKKIINKSQSPGDFVVHNRPDKKMLRLHFKPTKHLFLFSLFGMGGGFYNVSVGFCFKYQRASGEYFQSRLLQSNFENVPALVN